MRAWPLLVLFVIGSAKALGLVLPPAAIFSRRVCLSLRVAGACHVTSRAMSFMKSGHDGDIGMDSDDDAHAAFQTCMNSFRAMQDNGGALASEHAKAVASEAKWSAVAAEQSRGGGGSRGSDTRRSNVEFRQNPRECAWWKMLLRGEHGENNGVGCRVKTSREGKLFRQRFRVPYTTYDAILADLRALPLGERFFSEEDNAARTPAHPLELKVLATLRILGRAWCFDDVTEATGMSTQCVRDFFHKFNAYYARKSFSEHHTCPKSHGLDSSHCWKEPGEGLRESEFCV